VARWLRFWLSTRTSIRPSTLRSYTEHVERHLVPFPGSTRVGELARTETRYGTPISASTSHRIRATLRSALNAAIRGRSGIARLAMLSSRRRAGRRRRCGPSIGSGSGTRRVSGTRSRCGPPNCWPVPRARGRGPTVCHVVAGHAARVAPG
jgi:hypothetical protein